MLPRSTIAIFATLAIASVVIFALIVYPGYLSGGSACPTQTTVSDRTYCAESVAVLPYQCTPGGYCANCPPSEFAFHGVAFQLALSASRGIYGVDGCVTEQNSTVYPFHLVGNSLGASSVNWTSPDHATLVEWQAPYATIGSEGQLTAKVTCGVSYALVVGL